MATSDYVDPEFVPFTYEELVASSVLLGDSEEDARAHWGALREEARRERGEAWGITLAEGTLLALSLISEELAERVDRLRNGSWEPHIRIWRQTLPEEEVERRLAQGRKEDRKWARDRERLKRWIESRQRSGQGEGDGEG